MEQTEANRCHLSVLFLLLYIGVIFWHTYKPLPEGISYAGDIHWTDDVEMFTDLTFAQNERTEEKQHELAIFDEVYDND